MRTPDEIINSFRSAFEKECGAGVTARFGFALVVTDPTTGHSSIGGTISPQDLVDLVGSLVRDLEAN